jgi:hypothetical protein
MAHKSHYMTRKRGRPEGGVSEPITPVKIVVDPTDDTPSYYSNYAETAIAQHDLALNFVRVPTKISAARTEELKRSGELKLEPAVQVFFAPSHLVGYFCRCPHTTSI